MPIGAATAAAATATDSSAKKTEDEARDTHEMQKADRKDSGLPDSGAGATMLTKATGAVWSPAESELVYFRVGNDALVAGRGGDLLYIVIQDDEGKWRAVCVGPGYVVNEAPLNLLSVPSMQSYGMGADFAPGGGACLSELLSHALSLLLLVQ